MGTKDDEYDYLFKGNLVRNDCLNTLYYKFYVNL